MKFKFSLIALGIMGLIYPVAPVYAAADPATATVSVGTASITADGSSTSLITLDTLDNTAIGETVVFSATGAGTIGVTADVGDGTYTATYTSSTTAGTVTITATIGGVAVTDDENITETAVSTPAPTQTVVYIPTTPQAALTLSSSATTVEWGTQAKLTLTGGSGTGKVTYSSTGSTFCAVDANGNLTPVSAGTCTVTANKDGDGTYGSAQSNSIVITATNTPVAASASGSTSESTLVVGKPVKGISTLKFKVADTHAGKKVSVIQAVKNSSGKTVYTKLGTAVIDVKGAISFKTKAKLPVGAVLQLKHTSGEVIFSQSIK